MLFETVRVCRDGEKYVQHIGYAYDPGDHNRFAYALYVVDGGVEVMPVREFEEKFQTIAFFKTPKM